LILLSFEPFVCQKNLIDFIETLPFYFTLVLAMLLQLTDSGKGLDICAQHCILKVPSISSIGM